MTTAGAFFYQDGTSIAPATRYYTPQDFYTVTVDDFVSLSEIATDDNFDQLYQTIWTASDRMFEPVNNPSRGWPLNRILAVGAYVFPANLPQSVRLKGIFGWSSVPYEVKTAAKIQSARLFLRNQSPSNLWCWPPRWIGDCCCWCNTRWSVAGSWLTTSLELTPASYR